MREGDEAIERLDALVQAMLIGDSSIGDKSELTALLELAAQLRGMPNDEFRERLAEEIARTVARGLGGGDMMEITAVVRGHVETIVPYLRIDPVAELLTFVKEAFGADELLRAVGNAGGLHAEARIGDSRLMMGGFPGMQSMPTALHLYVEDADTTYARAVAAGATTLHPPADQPYGDREASVRDPFSNHWCIATHRAGGAGTYRPATLRDVTPYLHPRGAGGLIHFLHEALGAEEQDRHESPGGMIQHATVRVGDSAIEMGEAHGQWQPMPASIYVDDVEALYERALRAGAVSVEPPREQPYGHRTAHVEDPQGNTWYLAQPIAPRRAG